MPRSRRSSASKATSIRRASPSTAATGGAGALVPPSAGPTFWSDSFNPVSPDLAFVADGERYRLSGLKRFATGAAVADVVIAGGVAEGGAHDGELVVFAIDANRAASTTSTTGTTSASGPRRADPCGTRMSSSPTTDIIGVDREEPLQLTW